MEHGDTNHGAMHQMDQAMPCDHSDCGNGCLATGAFSKAEFAPKAVQFVDVDDAVNNSILTFFDNKPLRATETGPRYYSAALPSTPVTRRDLLLE